MRMEEKDYAGRGTTGLAATGTALGGAALAGVLSQGNGLFGGLFGGNGQQYISKFELEQQNKITEKDMEIAYLRGRDAAKSDTLETYAYINGELNKLREKQAAQDVKNAQIEGTFMQRPCMKSSKNMDTICLLTKRLRLSGIKPKACFI